MSDDLRYRFKQKPKSTQNNRDKKKSGNTSGGIFGIWDEQRRMQIEEDKLARELVETKKKAKELSKTLRKHRYGEVKQESLQKLTQLKKKTVKQANKSYRFLKNKPKTHKKLYVGVAFLAIGIVGLLIYLQTKQDSNATLGESTESTVTSQELPTEKPSFSILIPSGLNEQSLDIKRTNPSGSAPTYTYIDSLAGSEVQFQVSQQEIPDNFNLEKTATDFQATSIIQIDDTRVYHGLSEKTKVQSLIFTKNDRLVLISSPEKFSDEQWAAYIITLR